MKTRPQLSTSGLQEPKKIVYPGKASLWADKYAPTSFRDFIIDKKTRDKVISWLSDWETVHIGGQKKYVKPGRMGKFEPKNNLNAKAVLLTGPPGIGKTSLARIVSRGMGFRSIELNASDIRNKAAVSTFLKTASLNTSINFYGKLTKCLLIMDEVDGMSTGDRGGIPALMAIIKESKVPIICIANDR
jgi:replication factor C subunit 1